MIVTNRLGRVARRNSFGDRWRLAVADARTGGTPSAPPFEGGLCGETCADPAHCLSKGTRFHDLRHFYASTLIAANLNPKVIQARLGHATITETMDTYGHLFSRRGRPRPRGHQRDLHSCSDGTGTEPGNVVTIPSQVSEIKGGTRPVGRVLCARLRGAAVIHLGLPLPAASCGLPASIGRAALDRSRREPLAPLLTLLRVGFTEPPQSPAALVVSYTTVSPLPRLTPGRSDFCGTVPRVTPGRRYRPPCPVEPGPSSPGLRPARPPGRLTRAQDTPVATGPA